MTIHGDPSRVRLADARDEEELFDICCRLHAENGAFPMSEEKVRQMLRSSLTPNVEERRGLIGVVGESGRIEGSIGLEIDAIWYADVPCLIELWNYVLPEHRTSSNSIDLIAFAKRMADHFNLELMIGVLSNVRTAAKVRHYRRQFGDPTGALWRYSPVSERAH